MLELKYGPYRVLNGTHRETVPVKQCKIQSVTDRHVTLEDGTELRKHSANIVKQGTTSYALYIDGQRVGTNTLKGPTKGPTGKKIPGEMVTLATQVEYNKSSEPFMSSCELDKVFQNKFVKAYEETPALQERDKLRLRVEELEKKLAQFQDPDDEESEDEEEDEYEDSEKETVEA